MDFFKMQQKLLKKLKQSKKRIAANSGNKVKRPSTRQDVIQETRHRPYTEKAALTPRN
jgi:hypothetical protein